MKNRAPHFNLLVALAIGLLAGCANQMATVPAVAPLAIMPPAPIAPAHKTATVPVAGLPPGRTLLITWYDPNMNDWTGLVTSSNLDAPLPWTVWCERIQPGTNSCVVSNANANAAAQFYRAFCSTNIL